ncbi:AAA family ATPase [Nonomuraea jiangxiensis]|uniref:AAA family ATPase n=1 Tax=Nonomuraea jiangxiensis TaxID=633440 RepID=UPI001FEB7EAA|nr:AAA family ATPase [Nonomuraea jiangxiensis]
MRSPVLYGRTPEITAIDHLIDRARGGAGGALALHGEAGVGKTALLDLAAARGGSMRVLRATGVEPEADLAFATLHQLLRPVTGLLDALPEPQRAAVRGALGLAADPSGDRFLVAAGVLSLLAEAAAADGLVCVVDDFQWVDRASADALLFAARRLGTERIAMLLAVRGDLSLRGVQPLPVTGLTEPAATALLNAATLAVPERDAAGPALPNQDITGPVTPPPDTARPAPLPDTARPDTPLPDTARPDTPLSDTARPDTPLSDTVRPAAPVPGAEESAAAGGSLDGRDAVSAQVGRELVALTRGNPLALRETVRRLTPDQLAGRAPLPDPLPGGTRLFGEQVAALPAPARRVALLAALESDLAPVLRAAAGPPADHDTEPDVGRGVLGALEAADLVVVAGTRVRFRHPLIRSAVYEAATPAERREAHVALAAVTDGDRRAWHLAEAALGRDERVAAALVETAARARDRGGYGAAATALARAAELTPAPRTRAKRLKDAATAAWLGGRPGQAESLLAEARELAGADAALAMEIARLQGRFELNSGSAAEAVRVLAAGDSLDMLADATEAASYVGDTTTVIQLGRRAEAFPVGFLRDVIAGIGRTLADTSGGHELLRRALGRTGELTEAAEFLWATAAASHLGEPDLAIDLAGRAGRVARVSGMAGQLPVVLEFVATAERIAGRLAESQAISEEGLELAREAGYGNTGASHLANLAVLAALRGEEEPCDRYAMEALAIAVPHRVGLCTGVAAYALAMLDLSLGRYAAAHDRFTSIATAGPGAGHPTVVWRSTPDRIEAAVGAGDLDAARVALAEYERWSAHAGTAESQALLARCRGLVTPPTPPSDATTRHAAQQPAQQPAGPSTDPLEALFEAVRLHANPFEAARTGLLLGERLRRGHRPGEARAYLRAALETFQRAGAHPWARRAHGELRAAGESAQPPRGTVLDTLTPQERRIAGLVADGLSSKEIAARLFLSPRTVEYHLYKMYPKLGVGTRTELARLVVLQKTPGPAQDML